MAVRLTVRKKGYKRKGYTATRGGKKVHVSPARVGSTTFTIQDRGGPGRGPKVVPPLEEGSLGGKGFFDKPASERHAIEKKVARAQGEKKVVGKLRAVQVFNKRVNPELSRKALADSKLIAGSFEGKKEISRSPRSKVRKAA
jgi:hypothetical protein